MLFSQSDSKDFNDEYILSERKITVSEPNGVGTVSYAYSLSFEDLPEDIITVSFVFDEERTSVGDILLKVTSNEKTSSFDISDKQENIDSSIVMVGLSDVSEMTVLSQYDSYGGSSIKNEEIVSLLSVSINDTDDITALKKILLFDIIKSLLVSAVVWIIVLIVVKSKADNKLFKNKFCIEKVFLFTALIVGVVFSFLFPIYQVPDEQTHINMLYGELNWDTDIKNQSEIANFADTVRIIRNYDQKINISTYFNMQAKTELPDTFRLPSLTVIRHLPQAVGIVLASVFKLPLWIALAFAEVFAAVCYAVFGYFTVKFMPFKKELMTALLLLPICLQEFPSFCYDSFMLSAYFVFFAYVLHVKFTKEKFTLCDVGIMLSLLAIIAITKIPYIFVAALILIIPISKIDFDFGLFRLKGDFIKKHRIIFVIGVGICFVLVAIVAVKLAISIYHGRVFIAAGYNLKHSLSLVFITIKSYCGEWLVQLTGDFGWFDTPVSLIFTVFVIANLLFLNLFDYNNSFKKPFNKNPFKPIEVVLVLIVALIMLFVVVISLFGWTMQAYGIDIGTLSISQMSDYMRQIPYIGGLQGRYFIPVLPLLLVPCYFEKPSKSLQKINHITYLCGYHLTVYIYVFFIVINRYWI